MFVTSREKPIRTCHGSDPCELPIAKTACEMVVDEPRCLHMGVDNCRSHKGESPRLEILADFPREIGLRRDFCHLSKLVYDGAPVHESPYVLVKTPKRFLDGEKRLSVLDGRPDLAIISDNTGVALESLDLRFSKTTNLFRVEVGKGVSVAFAPFQDSEPTQSRLCSFENDELEVTVLFMDRDSPFGVVIRHIDRLFSTPGTTRNFHAGSIARYLSFAVTGSAADDRGRSTSTSFHRPERNAAVRIAA